MTPFDQVRQLRPSTYRVSLHRDSAPGEIDDPTLVIWPPLPIYPELTRCGMTIWQKGEQWREEDAWLIPPPATHSSLARFTTAPLPSTSVSDGHRIWTVDPTQQTVTRYPYSPAGTWPASTSFLKHFSRHFTLAAILESNFHCTTGSLLGRATIADRPAVVVEFGEDRCRRGGRGAWASKLLRGRTVFWIDAETFITLQEDLYAYGRSDHLIRSTRVTRTDYDMPVDQSLFEVTVPPGYNVVEDG
jgi:outer membrane lipoprotein-sorting protein